MDSENVNEKEPMVPRAPDQVGKDAAAKFLGISPTTLDRWVKKEYIHPVRLPSGRRRFTLSELKRVRDEMESNSRQKPAESE